MSRVEVRYVGLVRSLVGKQSDELDLPDDIDLNGLLHHLIGLYGDELRASIFTRDGMPRRNVWMLIDGKSQTLPQGLESKLAGGHKVSIVVAVMPITGG